MYIHERFLPLDAGYYLVLLKIDLEVFALVVTGDAEGYVCIGDRLGPFVGEGVLFGLLLGLGRCLFGWGQLWF